jgi:hypothetical protein
MITGSCLCGDQAYEVDALAAPPSHCHCRTCQKAHSAAFATTARVRREHFRWVRGEATRAAYESTPGKLRRFCTRCGSHMISEWVHLPMVILRIATIDEGDVPEPDAHIWISHQAPWDHGRDSLERFDEGRPS